jgi:GntR family transcriptional regulator, transcriptional repressor for pyruvate dehydrogenase complex
MKRAGRRNLSHVVADELLLEIQAGKYGPGGRLPTERGLMERFGVGRSAIREAIQALVAMGILDVRPGVGAVVIGIGTQEALDTETISALLEDQTIDDLYDFRELLETEAAARAATGASPGEVAGIAAAFERIRAAVEQGSSSYQADLDFHRAVVAASANVIFLRMLDQVADLLSTLRRQTELVPGAAELAVAEHEAICRAIENRDADAARRASVQHIASGRAAVAAARRMARAKAAEEGAGTADAGTDDELAS